MRVIGLAVVIALLAPVSCASILNDMVCSAGECERAEGRAECMDLSIECKGGYSQWTDPDGEVRCQRCEDD